MPLDLFDCSLKQDCKRIQKCVNGIKVIWRNLMHKRAWYKFIGTKVHRLVFKINVKVVKLNVPTAAKTYTKKYTAHKINHPFIKGCMSQHLLSLARAHAFQDHRKVWKSEGGVRSSPLSWDRVKISTKDCAPYRIPRLRQHCVPSRPSHLLKFNFVSSNKCLIGRL